MAQTGFKNALILGGGYSARLAACALAPVLPLSGVIGLIQAPIGDEGPDAVTGQRAHSHVFLPRLEQELGRINPDLPKMMAQRGFRFQPGSTRLHASAPMACRRLFATRWQFDNLIDALFQTLVVEPGGPIPVNAVVRGFETDPDTGAISALHIASDDRQKVGEDTLIVDAMGTRSPIMEALARDGAVSEDAPSQIAYLTRFFRLNAPHPARLPDPLVDCPHNFGAVFLMLYPAANGWFSVSLAVNSQRQDLVRQLRDPEAFAAFARQSPHAAAWLDAAEPKGPLRLYVNPRNRWNVDLFAGGRAPRNYLAVGDALTSMLPTLGANCSFAATHIRIMRDLIAEGSGALQQDFAAAVHGEQRVFFDQALASPKLGDAVVAFAGAARTRPLKRVKAVVRRALGIDRRRIIKQLASSSSI